VKKFMSYTCMTLAIIGIMFLFTCLFAGIDTEHEIPGSQDRLPDYIDFWVVFGVASTSIILAAIGLGIDE
jgi:hypothetical protein